MPAATPISLYPPASEYTSPTAPTASTNAPAPAADPVSDTHNHSSGSLPSTYELLVELPATITEGPPPQLSHSAQPVLPVLTESLSGTLRVIQGPRQDSAPSPAAYHAFISLESLNVPLLPTHTARRLSVSPPIFEVRIPHRVFAIRVQKGVAHELVDSLQTVLQWFCGWVPAEDASHAEVAQGAMQPVHGAPPPPSFPPNTPPSTPDAQTDRFAKAGEKGVEFVERWGNRINTSIQKKLSARVEKAKETDPRQAKLGGKITGKALAGARVVVGKGAAVAHIATEKISGVVGKGFAKNPVTKSFSAAPQGTVRRNFHDNLMAGMLAFGRIYVAADSQGKLIIEDTGKSASEYARATYGDEAENVARQVSGIALDGYRISRFPKKLGASAMLRGALKSTTKSAVSGEQEVHGQHGEAQPWASAQSAAVSSNTAKKD